MAEVVKMRRMSDTMEEGVVVNWIAKVGDSLKIGDVLAEVETDKATMDFDSQVSGVLLHIEAKPGQTVPVGGIMCVIGKAGEDISTALQAAKQAAAEGPDNTGAPEAEVNSPVPVENVNVLDKNDITNEKAGPENEGRIKASPLARKVASDSGIDLRQLKGSGEGGRIVKKDVENYSPAANTARVAAVPYASSGAAQDVPLSQMRKSIARRLSESKFSAPHFYLTRQLDMDRVVEARAAINEFLGAKVSYNDILIKAVAAALRANPKVNASWHGDFLRYHSDIHIGVATAIDEGLIVPVVKHADRKGIAAISTEVRELAQKAKDKKLQPEEFSGNTFTISNLGMFGIEQFTAIINPPDACILAVGAIVQQPVVKNGQMVVGNTMKVTLSCDHRVVDGAVGARFLQTLAQYLEEPLRILA
ncbi:MAG: pyruvate dehydrogenase complex dihydrolipoamide acetyltransferase [Bacteroidetes bacterium]|nr:pyruvate dehydrogenase complex dihydrolipoamide acetyltransferase [Bacteroidota bacterium]